jgi:mono/diheme cytochrome c family protein
MASTPSRTRTRPLAAPLGRAAVAALALAAGAALPARAQAPALSHSAQAADTSWFARYHPAPQDTLSPSAYDGWKLFQTNCSRCHGQSAEGTSFAPSLVQALSAGGPVPTEQVFLGIACKGIAGTGMPAWCSLGLGNDQLQTIYAYLEGRADGAIGPGRPTVRQDSTSAGQ